ncbi:hypothetical protein N7504_002294 [Penicillium tannophilum]|nr:hypothetical protein N7504_002294 [Penicillium tannophilum]
MITHKPIGLSNPGSPAQPQLYCLNIPYDNSLVGGGGGAFIGHQMDDMATAGVAIIGALGAMAVTHSLENQQQQEYHQYHQYQPQGYQQAPYPSQGYQKPLGGTIMTTTTRTTTDNSVGYGCFGQPSSHFGCCADLRGQLLRRRRAVSPKGVQFLAKPSLQNPHGRYCGLDDFF